MTLMMIAIMIVMVRNAMQESFMVMLMDLMMIITIIMTMIMMIRNLIPKSSTAMLHRLVFMILMILMMVSEKVNDMRFHSLS